MAKTSIPSDKPCSMSSAVIALLSFSPVMENDMDHLIQTWLPRLSLLLLCIISVLKASRAEFAIILSRISQTNPSRWICFHLRWSLVSPLLKKGHDIGNFKNFKQSPTLLLCLRFWNGWPWHGSGLTVASASYCSLQFVYHESHCMEIVLIKITNSIM